jgi:predicted nucleotide-binding protein
VINRFQGAGGEAALIRTLLKNEIVAHDEVLAKSFITAGELLSVNEGEVIVEQDDCDDDVFFIISGRFSVRVNNNEVASREVGDYVGEMSVLTPNSRRTATVIATEASVVLRVPSEIFLNTVMQNSKSLFGAISVLVHRLNNRNTLVRRKNIKPNIFIISSVEGLEIAKGIEHGLQHSDFEVTVWDGGTFVASDYPLPCLTKEISKSDFCIVVASPDDKSCSRGKEYVVPRDNVIFEAGLGVGALGYERTLVVVPRESPPKLPSDLTGLTTISYYQKASGPAIGPVCNEIMRIIKKHGIR